ncbi:MAG: ParB/RepB/Spo0J family partition protein [Thermodesulfobacteriota bacterium]
MERKTDPVKKKVLGRGLSALLSPTTGGSEPADSGVLQIPLEKIRGGSLQPRKSFPPEALSELVASIREKGVLQPVLVRPTPDGYELVAGERRFRAAESAGLSLIPALVRRLTDREALEVAIVENVQRADLNAIELAEGYYRLQRDFNLSQEQVAERVGKDRATVANTVRLLKLPSPIRQAVVDGSLSAGHARALLTAPPEHMLSIFEAVRRRGLSVRETERLCTGEVKKRPGRKTAQGNVHLKALEEELTRRGGTRVRLRGNVRKGRIEVHYFSSEELDRLQGILFGGK